MTSVGIEGTVAKLCNQYIAQGATGIKTYIKSVIHAYFKTYKRAAATITVDGTNFEVKNLLSLMVVKQPYYGFGLNVMPEARFDDQLLHIRWVNSGLFKCMVGAAASLTIGNRTGQYRPGRRVTIELEYPLFNQIDGNEGWSSKNAIECRRRVDVRGTGRASSRLRKDWKDHSETHQI